MTVIVETFPPPAEAWHAQSWLYDPLEGLAEACGNTAVAEAVRVGGCAGGLSLDSIARDDPPLADRVAGVLRAAARRLATGEVAPPEREHAAPDRVRAKYGELAALLDDWLNRTGPSERSGPPPDGRGPGPAPAAVPRTDPARFPPAAARRPGRTLRDPRSRPRPAAREPPR